MVEPPSEQELLQVAVVHRVVFTTCNLSCAQLDGLSHLHGAVVHQMSPGLVGEPRIVELSGLVLQV
jgi:hypothetical protein